MSLFQKKTVEHSLNFTLNKPNNLLIVGLGNIGKEYENTRHNIGFDCLDELRSSQSEFTPWQTKKDLHCLFSSANFSDTKVILVKPTTFVNNSGKSISSVLNYFKLPLKSLVVVHDDLDINFGLVRCKIGGSSAGHNGIKSISNLVGEDYGRIRIGVNNEHPPKMETADYVLAKFSNLEQTKLPLLKREVQSILTEFIYRQELLPETRNFLL